MPSWLLSWRASRSKFVHRESGTKTYLIHFARDFRREFFGANSPFFFEMGKVGIHQNLWKPNWIFTGYHDSDPNWIPSPYIEHHLYKWFIFNVFESPTKPWFLRGCWILGGGINHKTLSLNSSAIVINTVKSPAKLIKLWRYNQQEDTFLWIYTDKDATSISASHTLAILMEVSYGYPHRSGDISIHFPPHLKGILIGGLLVPTMWGPPVMLVGL